MKRKVSESNIYNSAQTTTQIPLKSGTLEISNKSLCQDKQSLSSPYRVVSPFDEAVLVSSGCYPSLIRKGWLIVILLGWQFYVWADLRLT